MTLPLGNQTLTGQEIPEIKAPAGMWGGFGKKWGIKAFLLGIC